MWGGNESIITMWKHGEITQDSPNTDPGGRRWRRGNGDIRDVIPVGTGHNPIWVYMILTAAVRMFKRMGLLKKLGKTKAMV